MRNRENPTGEKSNPAKTCRQLFDVNTEFRSGNYYINPNENEEPIYVYCDRKTLQTCIESVHDSFPLATLPPIYTSDDDPFVWSIVRRVNNWK